MLSLCTLTTVFASLCMGQLTPAPKLTYAYSTVETPLPLVNISTPFGTDLFIYFNGSTITGPLINATTLPSQGVAYVPVMSVGNKTQFRFQVRSQGVTSDGVPFWLEENGLATAGSATIEEQTWHIGGNYSFLSLSKLWCKGAQLANGTAIGDCYLVS